MDFETSATGINEIQLENMKQRLSGTVNSCADQPGTDGHFAWIAFDQ